MDSDFDEKKLRRLQRRFFINPKRIHREDNELIASLDEFSAHHIRTVLRIGTGARIVLFDGSGKEYLSEIVISKPSYVKAKILETRATQTESPLEITLAQALIKENAFDKILTSATELGINKIIPVLTKRVVVNLKTKDLEQKMLRWRKILEESSALSSRVKVPEMTYPVELSKLLSEKIDATKIFLWEKARGGELKTLEKAQNQKKAIRNILLLTGPEGGFEDSEAEQTISAGFIPLGLGPRILRAETAAITAISIIQYLFGDLSQGA